MLKKIDMRFGTWTERILIIVGSLMTVWRDVSKYKMILLGVQEVR